MADETPRKNPWPLRIILLVILGVMLLALGWDRLARNRCVEAWERVSKLHQEMIAKPGDAAYGPEKVREAIGWRSQTGEPVAKEHYYEEIYQLRGGLPWQRYYLCIIYQDVDGKPVYFAPFQGRMPESREIPTKPLQYEELLESVGGGGEDTEDAPPEPEDARDDAELPDGESGDVGPGEEDADGDESSEEESADVEPAADGGEEVEAN